MNTRVLDTVESSDGLKFELFRSAMRGVPRLLGAGEPVLQATRKQVRKAFAVTTKTKAGRSEYKEGRYVWASVRYTLINADGSEMPDSGSDAYARATKTIVHIGCQTFRGKNARILRDWAAA